MPAKTFGKYAVPGDMLTVSGVYSSAVYLENPRGDLVVLHDREYGLVPFGLGVADAGELIAAAGLAPGMEAAVLPGELAFPKLTLTLNPVSEAEPPFAPESRTLADALTRGKALLCRSGRGSLSELLTAHEARAVKNPFAQAAFGPVRALRSALAADNCHAADAALLGILGLGPGLTPALDDFVSALCAALLRARDIWGLPVREAGTLASAAAALAPARTGAVSAAYLLASARGEAFSRLADVLRPLPEPVSAETAKALLAVGGGSGADMLAGTLFALSYLLENYVPIQP